MSGRYCLGCFRLNFFLIRTEHKCSNCGLTEIHPTKGYLGSVASGARFSVESLKHISAKEVRKRIKSSELKPNVPLKLTNRSWKPFALPPMNLRCKVAGCCWAWCVTCKLQCPATRSMAPIRLKISAPNWPPNVAPYSTSRGFPRTRSAHAAYFGLCITCSPRPLLNTAASAPRPTAQKIAL